MTKPVHPLEQMRSIGFEYTNAIVTYCYSTDYSSCVRANSGKRHFEDLIDTKKDYQEFEKLIEKFGIKKGGKQEVKIYKLNNAPYGAYKKKFNDFSKKISAARKSKTNQKFLLICLFAMHGLMKDGSQHIVINEFDPRTKFYRLWNAEL